MDRHAGLDHREHRVALAAPARVDAQQLADSFVGNCGSDDQPIDVVAGNAGIGQRMVEGLDGVAVRVVRLLAVTDSSVIPDVVGLADANDGGYFRQAHSRTPSARSAAIRSGV